MPQFFPTRQAFREWLHLHHETERELVVGFHRRESGCPSITWPESVEEALCFGWIDGVRHKHGDDSYTIRFTPRNPTSIWSRKNLSTMERLIAEGLAFPAGRRVYETRDKSKTNRYSFEQGSASFTAEQERTFRKNANAWKFWESQVPSYRKPATWWVVSAKQEVTREKRLQILIDCSARGLKIPPLRRPADNRDTG